MAEDGTCCAHDDDGKAIEDGTNVGNGSICCCDEGADESEGADSNGGGCSFSLSLHWPIGNWLTAHTASCLVLLNGFVQLPLSAITAQIWLRFLLCFLVYSSAPASATSSTVDDAAIMASGVVHEHIAALDGIVSCDITVTGALVNVCSVRWDELITVEMRTSSTAHGEARGRGLGDKLGVRGDKLGVRGDKFGDKLSVDAVVTICMASGVEHCATLDGIVGGDITVTGALACCVRWDELVTVEMRLDGISSTVDAYGGARGRGLGDKLKLGVRDKPGVDAVVTICMASGVEHCAALDGIVSGDITVTGAQVCCIRWDELVTVEMQLDEVVSVEIGEAEHCPIGAGLIGGTCTSASSLSAMGEGAATDEGDLHKR